MSTILDQLKETPTKEQDEEQKPQEKQQTAIPQPVVTPPQKNWSRHLRPRKQWLWSLLIPACGGAAWAGQHTELLLGLINQPYSTLFWAAGLASVLAFVLIIKFFQGIILGCKTVWKTFRHWMKKNNTAFFWIVITVCLVVSITQSGPYFNELIGRDSIFGISGYAVALVIDLVSIIFMQARLHAVRMRDKVGSTLYLIGVLVCSGLSGWANLYSALQHYQAPTQGAVPGWMVHIAPWTEVLIPLLNVIMSFALDHVADNRGTIPDPVEYEKQEKLRIQIQQIRLSIRQERAKLNAQEEELHSKKESWLKAKFTNADKLREMEQNIQKQIEEAVKESKKPLQKQLDETLQKLLEWEKFWQSQSQLHANEIQQAIDAALDKEKCQQEEMKQHIQDLQQTIADTLAEKQQAQELIDQVRAEAQQEIERERQQYRAASRESSQLQKKLEQLEQQAIQRQDTMPMPVVKAPVEQSETLYRQDTLSIPEIKIDLIERPEGGYFANIPFSPHAKGYRINDIIFYTANTAEALSGVKVFSIKKTKETAPEYWLWTPWGKDYMCYIREDAPVLHQKQKEQAS